MFQTWMPEPFSPGSLPGMPRIRQPLDDGAVAPRAGRSPKSAVVDRAVRATASRGAATWMPDESRPRSPPPRPSMSKPSIVTPAARTRTTLPRPGAHEARPAASDEPQRAVDHEVAAVRRRARPRASRPARAASIRACSGDSSAAGGPALERARQQRRHRARTLPRRTRRAPPQHAATSQAPRGRRRAHQACRRRRRAPARVTAAAPRAARTKATSRHAPRRPARTTPSAG